MFEPDIREQMKVGASREAGGGVSRSHLPPSELETGLYGLTSAERAIVLGKEK